MLYAIATILKEGSLYGYRVLDIDTGNFKDCAYEFLTKEIICGIVDVENISIEDNNIVIKDICDYTIIENGKVVSGEYAVIVIERTSLIDYKCIDYTGRVFYEKVVKLTDYGTNLIIIDGHIENDMEIVMDNTYEIDSDKVRYLTDKLNKYRAKIAMLGDTALDIQIKGDEAVLIQAIDDMEECIIPSFVTIIWQEAFSDIGKLKSIYIPDSIRFIGYEAFSHCYDLNEVVMGDGEIDIDSKTFYCCTELRHIKLSNKIKEITKHMFWNCYKMDKIDIPESVKEIGASAFEYCGKLQEVQFNGTIDKIGYKAFSNCDSIESLELPYIKNTGENIFYECEGLKDIKLTRIDTISHHMFGSCESLKKIVIAEGVTEICEGAFNGCVELRTVVLPSTIQKIHRNAFSDIEHIVTLVVEKGYLIRSVENTTIQYIGTK